MDDIIFVPGATTSGLMPTPGMSSPLEEHAAA